MNRIIGIDPGASCGIVVLDGGEIASAFNIMSENLWDKLTSFLVHPSCTVAVEDIRPYSLRLTPQVIDTCKFIGELNFRLKTWSGATVEYVARNHVKKWCFEAFPEVCIPFIEKKIAKKGYTSKVRGDRSGEDILIPRKPSFVFVDDKIVTESMKVMYNIPIPPSGKGYMYGLKAHSWQALAVASYWAIGRPLN